MNSNTFKARSQPPLVSVVIVTYNSATYITACIESVLKLTWKPVEVIVYDNCSTDATVALVRKFSKKIIVISSNENDGYATGNNTAVARAKGKYILILNPDTIVDRTLLEPLIETIESDPAIAACQPAVYLMQQPELLNLTGKISHYLGFDWLRDYQARSLPLAGELQSISGCCILIRREHFQMAKGFDDAFFLYFEDTDLSWRWRLMGFKLMFVPTSRVLHHYKFIPDPTVLTLSNKIFYYERNRLLLLLKNYSFSTLCALIPIVLFSEFGMLLYCLKQHAFLAKVRSYVDVIRKLPTILESRKHIQKIRTISDCRFINSLARTVRFAYFDSYATRLILNPITALYHTILLRIIRNA